MSAVAKPAKAAAAVPVAEDSVLKAVTALVNHLKKETKREDLIVAGTPLFVTIRQFRIPGRQKGKPIRIRMPHSVLNPEDGVSLCIIVKDPAKGFKEQLAAAPVPGFTKVIGASKLRKNYSQYKDKLALVAQYDGFFADARVVRMMPQLLGKIFDDRRKMPVPVDVAGKRWAENMAEARDSTYLSIGPQTVSVKIGHSGMAAAELCANAMAVLAAAVPRLPKKWANVQRVDVMGTNTVPLPVYKALPQQLVYEDGDSEDEEAEEDGESGSESEEDESSDEEADETAVAAAAAKADADAELDDDAEVNALRFLVGKEGAKLSKEPRAGAGAGAVASSTASAAAAAKPKPKGKAAAAAAAPAASRAAAPASKRARVEAPPSDDDEDDDDLLGDDVDVSDEEEEEAADPDVEVEVTRRRKGAIAEKLGATGKAAAAGGKGAAAAGAGKPAAAVKTAGKAAAAKPAAAATKPAAAAAAAPAAAKAAAKKPVAAAPASARPKAAAKPAAKAGKGK